jgi:formate dehydrogenase maturation protein FdhE
MATARTQCPFCQSFGVTPLEELLHSPGVDYFLCEDCKQMWHIERGHDGPPRQELLGQRKISQPEA